MCALNLVALDDVKKNAAKLKKNAWLATDNIRAITRPKAAPDIFTDLRLKATIIKVIGANVENSHLIGDITFGSKNVINYN